MHWTDYEGTGARYLTIDRMPREDRPPHPQRLDLQPRLISRYGFSPRVTIIHERRDTNAQGLDYSRTRGDSSFVKQF